MKRLSKIIILLCTLAVLAGGYFIVSALTRKETTAANEKKETVALSDHTVDEITAISWSTDEGNLRFTKDDAGWHYDADAAFPVNESTMDSQAEKLCALSADRKIENVTDTSIYGLNEPAFTLTAEWKDGSSTSYSMGDATAFADGYYVARSGDDKVYTIATSLVTTFQKTLNSLAVNEEIPTVDNVTEAAAAEVKAFYEEISNTINTDQHWRDEDGVVLDTTSVEKLISNIQSLSWEELVTGSAADDALEAYGLGDTAKMVSLSNAAGDKLELMIGSANEDGDYYAKLPDSKMVYTLAQDDAEAVLQTTADSLKVKNGLLTLPYEDVASAEFITQASQYTLEIPAQEVSAANTEENSETTQQDDAAEDAAAEETPDSTEDDRALWEQIIAIVSLGDAEEKDGESVLKVKLKNINGVEAELVIREYDAENYAASLDGSSPVLVSAEKVDKIVRTLKQMQ